MSNRTFRAATEERPEERSADAAAMTGHLRVALNGATRACFCSVGTEHDATSNEQLTVTDIAARKSLARTANGPMSS